VAGVGSVMAGEGTSDPNQSKKLWLCGDEKYSMWKRSEMQRPEIHALEPMPISAIRHARCTKHSRLEFQEHVDILFPHSQ